jgi:hypothetical protein
VEIKNKKTIIASALSVILIISLLYFGLPFATKKTLQKLSSSYAKKLNRKIDLGKVSFSFIDGIVIYDINIFAKNDSAKSVYSIKKTAIKFKTLPLLKGNLILTKIKLVNAKLTLIRNKNGYWDFSDIQAILPKPKDKFYSDWPKRIIAKNSEIFIVDKISDNMWSLDNADLKFHKRLSYYGGSFSISGKGVFKGSFLKNSFISKKIKSNIKMEFEDNSLNSLFGEINLKDSSCNEVQTKSINLKWNLLNINSQEDKQDYKAEFKIEEILIANIDNSFRKNITEAFKTFSKIYGKELPKIDALTFKNISAKSSFKKDAFLIQDFKIDSNIFNIDADFKLDKEDKIDLNFKGKIVDKEMTITMQGLYNNPHIKPEFSYTIRTKLVSFIKAFTKNIKTGMDKIKNQKLKSRQQRTEIKGSLL